MNQDKFVVINPEIGVVGLKLTRDMRDEFKRNARMKRSSMQEILETFVMMFNRDPSIMSLEVAAKISSSLSGNVTDE